MSKNKIIEILKNDLQSCNDDCEHKSDIIEMKNIAIKTLKRDITKNDDACLLQVEKLNNIIKALKRDISQKMNQVEMLNKKINYIQSSKEDFINNCEHKDDIIKLRDSAIETLKNDLKSCNEAYLIQVEKLSKKIDGSLIIDILIKRLRKLVYLTGLLITCAIIIIIISVVFQSNAFCSDSYLFPGSPSVYASDGTYLGRLSDDPFEKDSIANPYGKYGSEYSSKSINNTTDGYGDKYRYRNVKKLIYID